jgi:hypothetical protein
MRLLCPIVRVPRIVVNGLRDHFSMGNAITAQLIRHDLSGFTTVTAQWPFEEAFSCCAITLCLEKNINDFAILIHRPP